MTRDLLPIVVDGLTARIRELVRIVCPDGEQWDDEWVALNPTRVDHHLGSFRVVLSGSKQGVWNDFALGDRRARGDALDLVAYCAFGGDRAKALTWAKAWLGLDGTDAAALTVTRQSIQRRAEDEQRQAEQAAKRIKAAKRIFLHETVAALRDTPAAHYLKARGIDFDRLGLQPGALKFAPACWHSETKRRHPALVAAIAVPRADGTYDGIGALHRTYLEDRGGGVWRKLSGVKDAKKTLGDYRGGFIRLWRGVDNKDERALSWAAMAKYARPGTVPVVITEGIEDALSVVMVDPRLRVVAGISIDNMAAIRWPAAVGEVTIFRDNDAAGAAADRALERVIDAYSAQGKRVLLVQPPAAFKDVNDWLLAIRAGKAA